MNSESEEPAEDRLTSHGTSQGTNQETSSPKARSYPSSSQRPVMYRFPDTKVCYFYKDGDVNFAGVKVAVSSRLHPTIASLQSELTAKMPDLPFGVRSIYTPRGRNCIQSVTSLKNDGRYICSTFAGRAHGLDINRVGRERVWNVAARPPSGKRAFNDLLRDSPRASGPLRAGGGAAARRQAWVAESDHVLYQTKTPKKIVVVVSGDPGRRQTLLLYRRTLQTFEQVLEDLSEMFEMPVRRMFTMDGRLVKSLSAIYSGPEMYMVTSGERPELWRKRDSETPYEPAEKRRKDLRDVSSKTKEKRNNRLSKTRGKFKVWVTTDDLPSAGTTAQVAITVYGHKGDSGLIPLGSTEGVSFQPGNCDEFEISAGSIGDVYKIRISHDNSGSSPSWLCHEVKLKDVHTEEEFLFECRNWLSRDEDDLEICREISVTLDGQHLYPVIVYDVTVVTGDLWNAGTSANVYLTIYGERGDTGVRQLYTAGDPEKFNMGQTDMFTVEAVSLGNLTRVIVGHDGVGSGNGWFLDQVVVKEKTKAATQWCFPCRRWLDEAEDDGKIIRELKLMDSLSEEKYKKELFDHQRWKFQTGSHVVLYSKMSQRPLQIGSEGLVHAKDEEDGNGVFLVLHKRSVYRMFQSLTTPKLHLALDNGRLTGQTKSSALTEFIVQPQPDRSVSLESVRFPRQFVGILKDGRPANSSGRSSDPSQHFFVYSKGVFRDRGVVILWTSPAQTLSVEKESHLSATGSRMRSALFRVHKPEGTEVRMLESILFPGQFIQIRDNGHCDAKGVGDGFCEFRVGHVKEKDYITLESVACRGLFVGMTPEGRVAPTVDAGGRNTRFYPEIVEYGNSKTLAPSPLRVTPEVLPQLERPTRKMAQLEANEKQKDEEQPMDLDDRQPSVASFYEGGDWKVWLTTAEPAKNADIALVIYGDLGNSGLIILGSSGSKDLFLAGNTDEFKVNLQDIGTVFKLRIELLPQKSKLEPSMKVKLVKLQNMTTKEVLRFKFDRWLSREKDDHDISRELPAVRPKQPVLPVVRYRVQTYTGTLPGSDTDAKVCVNLFGERGDIGKRILFRSDNETKFLEGQVDTFEFEAVALGALSKCFISHDGFGPGEGWYCQQVVVTELVTQKKYVFPCDMWLDSSIDDGKTERILRVKEQGTLKAEKTDADAVVPLAMATKDKPGKYKPGDWLLTTVTGQQSDHRIADTVVCYAYGEKGVAGPIELGNGSQGKLFGPGKTDEFKVNFGGSLGSLYKVRIGLLEEKEILESSWFLQKLKMKNLSGAREILSFDVNRWLSRTRYDCAVWRELAVSGPGKRPLPLLSYHVEVHTGSIPGSDTSAAVFLHIHGRRGDAGKRRLYKSQNEVKFQLGQVDIFEIQAVSLDEISKVVVSHDCTRKGGGWYLEKVVIREGHARVFHFPCGRWLDAGKGDGAIERVLTPQDLPSPSPVLEEPSPQKSRQLSTRPLPIKSPSPEQGNLWKIWISQKLAQSTSEPLSADGVIVVIYGNKGISDEILLNNGLAEDDDDHVTEYKIHLYERPIDTEIGAPYKVRLGLKTSEIGDLFIKQVQMRNMEAAKEYSFEVNSTLSSATAETGWVEVPLNAVTDTTLPVLTYLAEVYTGDVVNGGTKAGVHLMIVGERGDTGRRRLQNPLSSENETFAAGSVDIFEIRAVDLLKPRKLVVGHDGRGRGSGWFLEKVIIYCDNGLDKKTDRRFTFPCNRWLDDGEDDGLIERELDLSSVPSEDDDAEDDNDIWKVYTKTGVYTPEDEEEEEEEDEGNTNNNANNEEELRKQEDFDRRRRERRRKFHVPPHPPTGQLIVVVYGNRGKTTELPLNPVNPDAEDMFEPGHEDEFKVRISQDVGDIYKIRIGFTDDTEEKQNWLLDSLKLVDAKTGRLYHFELNSRLIKDEEFDGSCEIPLSPANRDDEVDEMGDATDGSDPLPVLNYTVEVYTGSQPNASTEATVHVMLVGERGDTGKRLLLKPLSTDERPFQLGQVDVFEIAAVDLLDVRKVIAGHSGKGKGQGWFLEKVVVRVTQDDEERSYDFPCNRWLEASLDDGLIERELLPSDKEDDPEKEPTPSDTGGFWTVSMTSGVVDDGDAAAEEREDDSDDHRPSADQLVIVVYGDQRITDDLPLEPLDPNAVDMLSPGHLDQFQVDFNDEGLGAVYKVRVGSRDGSTVEKNWFPKSVLLKNKESEKSYRFEADNHRTKGRTLDGWWEIPVTQVSGELVEKTHNVYTYEVEVHTASRNPLEVPDCHVTLLGERGDTGKRTFQKPLSSAEPEFPTPELLAEKQRVFHQDDQLKRHLQGSSADSDSPPPPFPPSRKKAEIFNADDYEDIDKHAKAAPLDLATESYDALVSYLVKPAKDDVGRVRALYVWLTSQHLQGALDFIGQDLPSSGTPLMTVLLVLSQQWFNGYSELLSNMCSHAGIPCKVIKGKVKGAGYWIGTCHNGTNDYCMVYVGGAWRFIDPHWGSLFSSPHSTELNSDSGSREEEVSGSESRRACAEFYFLTDPEALVFTHLTCEPALQLLARPVTEIEFWEMAFLKEAFFDLEMTSVSQPKCVLEANDEGKVVLEFGLLKRRRCQFSYELSKSTVDPALNAIGGASLDQFVTMENLNDKLTVTIHFPMIGRYRFELFGRDIQAGTVFSSVCEYAIYCKNPDFDFLPNPVNPRKEWGPGARTKELGLKPLEPRGGLVTATDGEAKIRFRMTKEKDIHFHGILKTATGDALEKCVCYYKTGQDIVFLLKVPHSGTFLFQVFTRETESSNSLQNLCNYLVKSEQSQCDLESYLPIDDETILVGDQTSKTSEVRINSVGLEEPVIGPLSQESIDITVSSSNTNARFRLQLQRHAHRNAVAEDVSEYAQFRRSKNILQISVNFPKFGFYKLSILTGDELLYVYLIEVKNLDASSFPFALTSPDWISSYAVLKPRTGLLDAATEYVFRLKIPGSQEVRIEAGNVRKDLARTGSSTDVWEANIRTPAKGGLLKVFSKDKLLLTYKVLNAEDAENAKDLHDKACKEEINQLKKLVATRLKELEKWKSVAGEKLRLAEEDFRANRDKYEKQEALLEWREEEEVEKSLSETHRNRPIRKRSSNNVFGMTRKLNVFRLEAVDLLDLRKVVVGHDRPEIGDGYYLEKAVVRVWSDSGLRVYNFPCNRWLDSGLDDGCTERELMEQSLLDDEDCWWKVLVKTGVPAKDGATSKTKKTGDVDKESEVGRKSRRKESLRMREKPRPPKGQLCVVIYGDCGQTKVLPLTKVKEDDPEAFTPGHVDEFKVKMDEDLGDVYKVRIGFDSSDTKDENWLLDTVVLQDVRSKRTYTFDFHDRLLKDKEFDGWLEAAVRPTLHWKLNTETAFIEELSLQKRSVYIYHVEVYTGDLDDAGTDADISVLLVGEQGDSGRRRLLKSLSSKPVKFRRGQMDAFEIEAVDLVDVRKVVIGHEGTGSGQGWFVDKVIVKAYTKTGVEDYTFTCDRWLFESVKEEHAEVSLLRDDLKPKKLEEEKDIDEAEQLENNMEDMEEEEMDENDDENGEAREMGKGTKQKKDDDKEEEEEMNKGKQKKGRGESKEEED